MEQKKQKRFAIVVVGIGVGILTGCAKPLAERSAVRFSRTSHNHLITTQASPTASSEGKLRSLQLDTGEWTEADHTIKQNSILHFFPQFNLVGVVNRYDHDNLQFFSFPSLKTVGPQISFNQYREKADLPNSFQDLVIVPSARGPKGYLTRLNGKSILTFALNSPGVANRIDLLPPYADDDGFAEPNYMALVGTTLFVQLMRLDRNTLLWTPTKGSMVIAIDTRTDKIIKTLEGLEGTNPSPDFKRDGRGNLFIATTGTYGEKCESCGIQPVLTKELKIGKRIVTEGHVRGKIEAFEFAGENLYVLLRNYKVENRGTKLVSFPLASPGAVRLIGNTGDKDEFKSLLYDKERKLIFASKDSVTEPEILVIDAESGRVQHSIKTLRPITSMELVE